MIAIPETNFRIGSEDDIGFIFESLLIMAQEQGLAEKRFHHTPDSLFNALFLQKKAEVVIAERSGNPVGLALFSITNRNFSLFDKPGIFIHDIFVHKSTRRKHIGSDIVNHIASLGRKRGCGRIDSILLKDNGIGSKFADSLPQTKDVDYIRYIRSNID